MGGQVSSDLCAKCYEKAELENSLQDGDVTEEEYEQRLKEIDERYD